MRKATNLSHIIELTSSSSLLVLASHSVVLVQNGITIKFGYKDRVLDKLHNGVCPVQIRSLDTSSLIRTRTTPTNCSNYRYWIQVVLSEPEPCLLIVLIIDIR